MGDESDWGWGRDFGGDMGVDFERLEVPLEGKRDRLEGFIVVRNGIESQKCSVSKGFPTRPNAAVMLPFQTKCSTLLLLLLH